MITKSQIVGNPKEAAELIAVLTKVNAQQEKLLKDILAEIIAQNLTEHSAPFIRLKQRIKALLK